MSFTPIITLIGWLKPLIGTMISSVSPIELVTEMTTGLMTFRKPISRTSTVGFGKVKKRTPSSLASG
jgi:hypothetical protein